MGLLLYLLTALCDVVSLWFRFWIGDTLLGSLFPNPLMGTTIGYLLAYGPWVWSLAALVGVPGGDHLTRFELGAREPNTRERSLVDNALKTLAGTTIVSPRRWYVLDSPMMHAYVVGDVLYLQRGLIEDDVLKPLQPILAHELGHLIGGDGRLVLALRRLAFPGCHAIAGRLFGVGETVRSDQGVRYGAASRTSLLPLLLSSVLFLFGGGLGTGILAFPWKRYWQRRELVADSHVRAWGYGPMLAEALRQCLFLDIAVPFMRTQPLVLNRTRLQTLRD